MKNPVATPSRKQALEIFEAALKAANPGEAIDRHVRIEGGKLIAGGVEYPLDRYRRIFVVGAGKATAAMAVEIERLLGERVSGGLINVKYGHTAELERIEINECAHPVPDAAGVAGAKKIAAIAAEARKDDLLLCLISGGASALLTLPDTGITLEAMQKLTQRLLQAGATIQQMNAVRKHLSAIKGGRLAATAYPATVLTLILSDVIGDDPSTIGSGPTAPDPTSVIEAQGILDHFKIKTKLPLRETPKPGDALFRRVRNVVVGSNRLAIDAAAAKARELGLTPLVLSSYIEGETREIASMHAAIAREIVATGQPARAPVCVISGGETTVTVRGTGKGGRNQEFVLAAVLALNGLPHLTVLSGGTDGTDGPTDAAGAIGDGLTLTRARTQGLNAAEFLENNDSYHFFERLHDLIKTGPTNTNVMDLRLMIVR
ncbi:MAG TPA: glycerate kinase [Bryobacteraceae bacterium]|jgi:hydroxypyruvate reductase